MGKVSERTFSQRYLNSQHTTKHSKITNYQGNANQTHNDISLHTSGCYKEDKKKKVSSKNTIEEGYKEADISSLPSSVGRACGF